MWSWYAEKHQRFEYYMEMWLHNHIIIIVCNNNEQRGQKVMTLGSQFFRKLAMCGYKGVSRWYRKVRTTQCHAMY